jgi:hypothetical protein
VNPDQNNVAVVQVDLRHPLPVHEGAVEAAEILDGERLAFSQILA